MTGGIIDRFRTMAIARSAVLTGHVLASLIQTLVGIAVVLGVALAAVETREIWMLVPSAIVLGSAYGLCLVAGLLEIQALAGPGALAGLTAGFYALTYLGFAAPYLLAEAAHLTSYTILLTLTAALALGTAALVTRQSARAT